MTGSFDIIVIGGGIAGLSAAAALAPQARVAVIEAEEQPGFHASGRSATMVHYALGDRLVRALTLASRPFFDNPADGFADAPLGEPRAVLVHAREDERAALNALAADIAPFATLDRLDRQGVAELCPLLRDSECHGIADRTAIRLDAHALLQGNLRALRRLGGTLFTGERIGAIARHGSAWVVTSERGERWTAPILINAAGAWADTVARLAGVSPIGLVPKRRTIITFDAPPGTDLAHLPFAKSVGDELYFAPESGRLFASPMDASPGDPCDAQADEYEVALAAHRMAERTSVEVKRIHSRWAGLRTFAPDSHPVVGFAPDGQGFFWLAGQGGFGLQTSPALAQIAAALVTGSPGPIAGVAAEALSPGRFDAE